MDDRITIKQNDNFGRVQVSDNLGNSFGAVLGGDRQSAGDAVSAALACANGATLNSDREREAATAAGAEIKSKVEAIMGQPGSNAIDAAVKSLQRIALAKGSVTYSAGETGSPLTPICDALKAKSEQQR